MIQYPPKTSFDSANGPSVTVGLPDLNETRAPADGGCSPSNASSTPASFSASLYFIIAATCSAGGTVPGAAVSYPEGIISIMNRMAFSSSVDHRPRTLRTDAIRHQAVQLQPDVRGLRGRVGQRNGAIIGIACLFDLPPIPKLFPYTTLSNR